MKEKLKHLAKGVCLGAAMCGVIYIGVTYETIKLIRRKYDKKTK